MNIKEDYVSFETAKLLKEKGFNEQTRDFYRFENNIWVHRNTYEHDYFNLGMPRWENCYSCLTLQMAMKWLREVHNLVIQIELIDFLEHGEVWFYSIIERKTIKQLTCKDEDFTEHSYEQAAEAAIKYCLENLI